MTGTKWMRTTPQKIAKILNSRGFKISRNTVAAILLDMDFSLKANRKAKVTSSSPDREQQFGIIQELSKPFEENGNPILSVDTKKKELIGNLGTVVVGTSADTPEFAVRCIATWWRLKWLPRPLDCLDTMLNYIKTTTTAAGLEVQAYLDTREYLKGVRISDAEMEALALEKRSELEKWSYTISPRLSA